MDRGQRNQMARDHLPEFLSGARVGGMKGNQVKVMASWSIGLNVQMATLSPRHRVKRMFKW